MTAPACAQKCQLAEVSGCNSTLDLQCLCLAASNPSGDVVNCVLMSCSPDDALAAVAFANNICQAVSMTVTIPSPGTTSTTSPLSTGPGTPQGSGSITTTSSTTTPNTSSRTQDTSSQPQDGSGAQGGGDGGLSSGAKAGIAVGVILVVLLAALGVFLLLRKRRRATVRSVQIEESGGTAAGIQELHPHDKHFAELWPAVTDSSKAPEIDSNPRQNLEPVEMASTGPVAGSELGSDPRTNLGPIEMYQQSPELHDSTISGQYPTAIGAIHQTTSPVPAGSAPAELDSQPAKSSPASGAISRKPISHGASPIPDRPGLPTPWAAEPLAMRPAASSEPSASELEQLMREEEELENRRKTLQELKQIQERQAALREKIRTLKGSGAGS